MSRRSSTKLAEAVATSLYRARSAAVALSLFTMPTTVASLFSTPGRRLVQPSRSLSSCG